MDYQVWTRDEYQELYSKVDCGDMAAVKRELDKAVREGREPILTVEVPYELNIKISEVGSEVKKDKAKPDKSTRAAGDGKIRRGDKEDTPGLDQGSGDNSAGDSAGD